MAAPRAQRGCEAGLGDDPLQPGEGKGVMMEALATIYRITEHDGATVALRDTDVAVSRHA
jgi:hypothetical protein